MSFCTSLKIRETKHKKNVWGNGWKWEGGSFSQFSGLFYGFIYIYICIRQRFNFLPVKILPLVCSSFFFSVFPFLLPVVSFLSIQPKGGKGRNRQRRLLSSPLWPVIFQTSTLITRAAHTENTSRWTSFGVWCTRWGKGGATEPLSKGRFVSGLAQRATAIRMLACPRYRYK